MYLFKGKKNLIQLIILVILNIVKNSNTHWKKNVPLIGVNGLTILKQNIIINCTPSTSNFLFKHKENYNLSLLSGNEGSIIWKSDLFTNDLILTVLYHFFCNS